MLHGVYKKGTTHFIAEESLAQPTKLLAFVPRVLHFSAIHLGMLSATHLRDRVFRPRSAQCAAMPFISQTHVLRPSKYKPWDDDTMQKALQAVVKA